MSEHAPEPVTAAANPPIQPLPSNLLPGDVVRASATADLPAPERQLTQVAKLIDVSKCIGCKASPVGLHRVERHPPGDGGEYRGLREPA